MLGLRRKKSGKCRRRKTVAGKCHANVIYLWTSKGLMDATLRKGWISQINRCRETIIFTPDVFG